MPLDVFVFLSVSFLSQKNDSYGCPSKGKNIFCLVEKREFNQIPQGGGFVKVVRDSLSKWAHPLDLNGVQMTF